MRRTRSQARAATARLARRGGPPARWKPRSSASCARRAARSAPARSASGSRPAEQRELSYSTVVTIVSRLHDKGLLARQRSGRGFTYTPVDEASLAASRMSLALGSGIDRDAVLSRFVSGLSGRDARLLRTLLAGAGVAGGDPGPPGGPGPAGPGSEAGLGPCGCSTCRW